MSLELETLKHSLQEETLLSERLQKEVVEAKEASDDLAGQVLSMKEEKLRADEELQSAAKVCLFVWSKPCTFIVCVCVCSLYVCVCLLYVCVFIVCVCVCVVCVLS